MPRIAQSKYYTHICSAKHRSESCEPREQRIMLDFC